MNDAIPTPRTAGRVYRAHAPFTILAQGRQPFPVTTIAHFPLTKEIDVLKHLYQRRFVRDTILEQTRFLHVFGRGFYLEHPLLSHHILIPPFVTDKRFCQIIYAYYEKHFIYTEDAYVEENPDA